MTDEKTGRSFSFTLNGRLVRVESASPQATLLDFLRAHELTGSKEGCAEGECGACAVVLVKPRGETCAYQSVNSCLVFLPMVAGEEVYTVESLGSPHNLHPVQRAIADGGGSQCGYCTPGFVMSLFAEQYRPDRIGPCSIDALAGNLCRCTGYRPIRDAALSLGPAPHDDFRKRLTEPPPIPDPFTYRVGDAAFTRPASLSECFDILHKNPDARLVAGATDLAVESNLKGASYGRLISVDCLPELHVFHESRDWVEIGAAVTLSDIDLQWMDAPPVVREWMPLFSSPLIRNRATLGGNLATASPIGDAAPLLLALDAEIRIGSASGVRSVPVDRFFTGYRQTDLRRDEVLLSISIPKPVPALARFYKVAKRRVDDISTVAACFSVTLDSDERVVHARFAFGGVAEVPRRVRRAEDAIVGHHLNTSSVKHAQRAIADDLKPISDHRGSAEYRLALSQSLLEKFWTEALGVAA